MAFQLPQDISRLLRAVIEGLRLIARLCRSDARLQCLDPPVFTSPMLRHLGYGEYEVRRLWRIARRRSLLSKGSPIVLYDCCGARFEIEPIVKHEVACHHRSTMTPVDYVDCRILGEECFEATHANKFYLYIRGRVEDNYLKINLAHLIALIARSEWDRLERLLLAAQHLLEAGAAERLELAADIIGNISRMVEERSHVIEAIPPKMPRSPSELARTSPILREIMRELVSVEASRGAQG